MKSGVWIWKSENYFYNGGNSCKEDLFLVRVKNVYIDKTYHLVPTWRGRDGSIKKYNRGKWEYWIHHDPEYPLKKLLKLVELITTDHIISFGTGNGRIEE